MARTVVTGGIVITQDPARRVIPDGCVIVEDATILAVGPAALATGVEAQHLDAGGCAIMPGLINAHTHLYNTFGRTLGADRSFAEWLREQKSLIAALDEEEFRTCVELGLADNLRSGSTCIVDNPAVPAAGGNRLHDVALGAARDLGARYILARGYTDQLNAPEYLESLPEIESRARSLLRWSLGLVERGFTVVLLGPPGTGSSQGPDDRSGPASVAAVRCSWNASSG